MKKIGDFIKRNIVCTIIAVLVIASQVLLYTPLAAKLAGVNEFFVRCIGFVTSLVPFSFLGVAIVLVLPLVALIVVLFVKSKAKLQFFYRTVSVALFAVLLFNLTMGYAYRSESVYSKIGLEVEEKIETQQLVSATTYFIEQANVACGNVTDEQIQNCQGDNFDYYIKVLYDSYNGNELFDFMYDFDLTPKQVFPSFVFDYSGISGMFMPMFGEVNVARNIPTVYFAQTLAHEIAHGKGVCNEGEAEFCAVIACVSADDWLCKYSGYTVGAIKLLNQVYAVDKEMYKQLRATFSEQILQDLNLAREYYAQFDGFINELQNKINNAYLKSNNVSEGTASYPMAVLSLVAYYVEVGEVK